jgi:hypothetical protein
MKRLCSILLFYALAGAALFAAKTLDIYFIDVDLGNAVLVVTPSGQAMMLDTGQHGEKYVNRILAVIHPAGWPLAAMTTQPSSGACGNNVRTR